MESRITGLWLNKRAHRLTSLYTYPTTNPKRRNPWTNRAKPPENSRTLNPSSTPKPTTHPNLSETTKISSRNSYTHPRTMKGLGFRAARHFCRVRPPSWTYGTYVQPKPRSLATFVYGVWGCCCSVPIWTYRIQEATIQVPGLLSIAIPGIAHWASIEELKLSYHDTATRYILPLK